VFAGACAAPPVVGVTGVWEVVVGAVLVVVGAGVVVVVVGVTVVAVGVAAAGVGVAVVGSAPAGASGITLVVERPPATGRSGSRRSM
jgi:hypothetical protein